MQIAINAHEKAKFEGKCEDLKEYLHEGGLINYYRDMWKQRSHILTPLTERTKVPRGSKLFKWDEAQDKAFQDIKKLISKDTMLIFP